MNQPVFDTEELHVAANTWRVSRDADRTAWVPATDVARSLGWDTRRVLREVGELATATRTIESSCGPLTTTVVFGYAVRELFDRDLPETGWLRERAHQVLDAAADDLIWKAHAKNRGYAERQPGKLAEAPYLTTTPED